MASLFQLPKASPVFAGESLSGAKLYFFAVGTTTPISVYTTAALSVAHDHPVVADNDGNFAPIFINDATNSTYRVQLKTSADVLKYDIDNLQSGSTAVLGMAQTISVAWSFSAELTGTYATDGSAATFFASSSSPAFRWNCSSGGSNYKVWEFTGGPTSIVLKTLTDAYGVGQNALVATRSGTTVTDVSLVTTGTAALKVDNSATATQTRLLIYDVDNGQIERVTVGAADSGGAGFKVLRIPN